MSRSQNDRIEFERTIEGEKFRYLPTPELLSTAAPTIFDSTIDCWVHDGDHPELIGIKGGKAPVVKVKLQKKRGGINGQEKYKIDRVMRITKEGIDETKKWIPFASAPESLGYLKALEPSASYIECWVNTDTTGKVTGLAEVHLKRLGLSFVVKKVEGKEYLFSQQFPGYMLVENPNIPSLPDGVDYLTLKNMSGECKVLVPRVELDVKFNPTPFAREISQKIEGLSVEEPLSWMEFELKNGDLSSRKVEAQLGMLYIWVSRGNFEKAFTLLNKLNNLDRFKDDPEENVFERRVIQGIIAILEKDKHPAAKAILLHLAVKVEHNHLKYPLPVVAESEEELFPFEVLLDAYDSYYSNHTNTTIHRLDDKQEKVVYDLIMRRLDEMLTEAKKAKDKAGIKKIEFIKKRIKALWGRRGKYLRKGTAKLGVRTWTIPQMAPETPSVKVDDLIRKFGTITALVGGEGFELPGFLIQDNRTFEENFFAFYQVGRSGTTDDREKLKKIMDLNSNVYSPYYSIIKDLCRRPHNYPKLEELQQAHAKYEDARKAYQAINRDQFPDFDAYWEVSSKANKKCDSARKNRKKTFAKLLPTTNWLTRIWSIVKKYFKLASSLLIGKFSFTTRAYEFFVEPFRTRYTKPSSKDGKERTYLKCDGKSLDEADKAFDTYFETLSGKYLKFDEVSVERNGGRLPEDHKDPNVRKKLKEENLELDHFRGSLPETRKDYSVKTGMKLYTKKKDELSLKKELELTATHLSTTLKTQKVALLWQINHVPEQTEKRSLKEIHRAGFRQNLSWDDLRQLTLDGSIEAFEVKTHLGHEEIKRVMLGTSDYLVKASRLEQMKCTIRAIEKVEGLKDEKRKHLFMQNVAAGLKMVRAYQPNIENRHRQWFEFANHYLYRQTQIDKLNEVAAVDSEEILAQMRTGWGKTKLLIPTEDYEKALKDMLVFNTWPAALEMTNATDVKQQMEESFGRMVDRFTFDRASAFTTESLKHLYSEMKKDKKEGRPINIRSESLRALELHFLLYLNRAGKRKEDNTELLKQVDYFSKILRMIRLEGWTTIDEAHVVLDVLDKLIYTIGDPVILPSAQVDVLEEFFNILTEGEFDELLHIGDNQQTLLSEDDYNKVIVPKLAKHFMAKLEVDVGHEESYNDFVMGCTGVISAWLEQHPKKELISLVKGMLTQILKASFKGSVDENYGLSKLHIEKKEYAISYASANTPKETKNNPSQFKNPHETMAKTYITYLHKGLSKDQVKKLVEYLKDQALKEAGEGSGSLETTKANEVFKQISPNSKKLLNTITDKHIDALYEEIHRNKQACLYYIRYIVVSQLKIYPDSLVSTVHNFRSQFASSMSLSATPQDIATHGPDTHFVPMKGTSGQVTHLLLTKCKDPKTLHKVTGIKPAEVLDETLGIIKENSRIHAVMDVGAQFKGMSNKEVAEKMRERFRHSDEVEAILFFDERDGLFKIMDTATGQIHDPSESRLDPELRKTFYDQSRCTGSDVKQAVDAIGLLMVGKETTKATAGQAGGRMRQWHEKQQVEPVYPEVLEDKIFPDGKVNITNMLVYWIANQAKQEADKNYQSQLQQMDNEIRRVLLDKLLGIRVGDKPGAASKKTDTKHAVALFKKFKSELFGYDSCNPWEMYAPIPEDKDPRECLEAYHNTCKDKVKSLSGLSGRERKFINNRLDRYPEKWEEMPLPEKVKANSQGLGMECEVLQEIEVEAEIEVQAQVKEDITKRIPSVWPENLNLFQPGWEKPTKQSVFFKKLAKKLTSRLPISPLKRVLIVGAIGAAVAAVVVVAMKIVGIASLIISAVGLAITLAGYGTGAATLLLDRVFTKGNAIYRVKNLMALHLPSRVSKGSRFRALAISSVVFSISS